MFYKPASGGIWDPSVIYHNGYYYMASMYFKDGEPRRDDYMWIARSEDGVHWADIGAVLEHKCGICKMFLYETDGGMMANIGSYATEEKRSNDTLRYFVTTDMKTWIAVGENHPDGQWYNTAGRWDHMYVYREDRNGDPCYYGYPVATPHPAQLSAFGLCKSCDGVEWEVCPPPVIEWGDIPPIDSLEGGGVEKIGDKYYYIGGFVGYARNHGYGVYTFVADSPEGPFRPDRGAFRLCGFDRLPGRVFVQNLASFGKDAEGNILITNAVDAGGAHEIWLLPSRLAVVDEDGHLRQGYWYGNEAVKGERISLSAETPVLVHTTYRDGRYPWPNYRSWSFVPHDGGFSAHTASPDGPNVSDHHMLVMLDTPLDLGEGVVLEGTVEATTYPPYNHVTHSTIQWRPSLFGLYFEEEDGGMDIALEIGHPYKRCSFVENIRYDESSFRREVIDTIGEDCANVRGMDDTGVHTFRVLCRRNVFELYLDDLHVQTFVHLGRETGRLGFTLQNSAVIVRDLKLFRMNLSPENEQVEV